MSCVHFRRYKADIEELLSNKLKYENETSKQANNRLPVLPLRVRSQDCSAIYKLCKFADELKLLNGSEFLNMSLADMD